MPPLPSEGEDFVDTLDEIVAHLRQDPILVQEIMGNGYTEELDAALTARAEDATYPVFVVYAVTPQGMESPSVDEEIASLVHAALDIDGVYVVHTTDGFGHVGAWGDFDPDDADDAMTLRFAQREAEDQISQVVADSAGEFERVGHPVEAAAVLEVAAEEGIPDHSEFQLDQARLEDYQHPMWREVHSGDFRPYDAPEAPTIGYSMMVAGLVSVIVLVCSYRLLQAWGARDSGPANSQREPRNKSPRTRDPNPGTPGGSPSPPPSASKESLAAKQRASTVQEAREELRQLERQLGDRDQRTDVGHDRTRLAARSHDTATRLLDSDDLLDVVGALVLARTGRHALTEAGTEPYRCCYVNPVHGNAVQREPLTGGMEVHVCADCASAMRRDRPLDSLVEVRRLALDRAYYTGDSVWAETGFGTLVDDLWWQVEQRGGR